MRTGKIRCYLEDGWQSNPVWGQSGPAYKAPRFQSGPGEMCVLHIDWPLGWDAVPNFSGNLYLYYLEYISNLVLWLLENINVII